MKCEQCGKWAGAHATLPGQSTDNLCFCPPKQPKQEPVAWGMPREDGLILDVICPEEHDREAGNYTIPLYTAPPKREWVWLTDEEINLIYAQPQTHAGQYAKAIQAKSKEKNT